MEIFEINPTFQKWTNQLKCFGLFVQIFTSANYVKSAEQLTFDQFDRLHIFLLTFCSFLIIRVNSKVHSPSLIATTSEMGPLMLLIFTLAPVRSQWASNIEPSNNFNDLSEKRSCPMNRVKFYEQKCLGVLNFWYSLWFTGSL